MLAPETYSYVHVLDDAEQVAHPAADRSVEIEHAFIKTRRRLGVALNGGLSPGRIYELLATEEHVASRSASGNHEFDPYF